MVAALEKARLDVASVHATQGQISDPTFLLWGRKTCDLVERLGASVVTVHPDRAKKNKGSQQAQALRHLGILGDYGQKRPLSSRWRLLRGRIGS